MARSTSTSSQSSRAAQVTVAQVDKPARRARQVGKSTSVAKRSAAPTVARVEKPKSARRAVTPAVTSGGVYLQVAAFSQRGNAEQLKQRLTSAVAQPVHIRAGQQANAAVYRVQVGPLADPNQAQDVATQLQRSLAKLGLGKVMIVAK
nr:SPOR domain-containing protein [Thiospirillum jenense]